VTDCATYRPPLVEQLHGPDPTCGSDCAICCARMALMFATCGKVNPSPDKIRAQSGLDKPNPPPSDFSTTIWEYQSAVLAFTDRARQAGFAGLTANVRQRAPWDDLQAIIKAQAKWVTVYVSYAVLNALEPAKSGDPGFGGAHAIGVLGYKSKSETGDGTVKFRVYDPLCDGRRKGIPKGPTWWRAATLRDAADAYASGTANATWCVTPRSKAA